MTTGTSTIVGIPISDLWHLKDAFDNLPEYATRELDPKHVENLAETDHTQWPPIQVVKKDGTYYIIDGYHRVEALKQQAKIKLLESTHLLNDTMTLQQRRERIQFLSG